VLLWNRTGRQVQFLDLSTSFRRPGTAEGSAYSGQSCRRSSESVTSLPSRSADTILGWLSRSGSTCSGRGPGSRLHVKHRSSTPTSSRHVSTSPPQYWQRGAVTAARSRRWRRVRFSTETMPHRRERGADGKARHGMTAARSPRSCPGWRACLGTESSPSEPPRSFRRVAFGVGVAGCHVGWGRCRRGPAADVCQRRCAHLSWRARIAPARPAAR
jgi:hypothetical protein